LSVLKYLLVTVFLTTAVYYLFAPSILERFLVVTVPVSKPDALVVMAGSKDLRLPVVADLYHQGVAPKILLANDGNRGAWSVKHQRNLYMVEWAREDLLELGVPEEAIELLEFSTSGSFYDALNTKNHVLSDGSINSLLVVTTNYHTRRSLWTFRQVFSDTDLIIGVYPVSDDPDYVGRYLKTYTVEFVKLVYYWLRYGMMGEWGVGSGEWGKQ